MNKRYFDHAATTQCYRTAAKALQLFSVDQYGNPSSSHAMGQEASTAILIARSYFAKIFKTSTKQIIFTGSGSEADNLALYGIALASFLKEKHLSNFTPGNIVISKLEHPAVKKCAESLKDFGFEIRELNVNSSAQISTESLRSKIDHQTKLVSIMRVNNILGTINPIDKLAEEVKKINPTTVFHSDCVQALGKVDVPNSDSMVDLVSISAHKIHGPKGIGALIVLNKELLDPKKLMPSIWGGGQEAGFRAGTQNVGLISAFYEATKNSINEQPNFWSHVLTLKKLFLSEIQPLLDKSMISINSPESACPHIISLVIRNVDSKKIAEYLNETGCMISTGSACSSEKSDLDPTLTAIGLDEQSIQSSVRVSFGLENSEDDVKFLAKCFIQCIQKAY